MSYGPSEFIEDVEAKLGLTVPEEDYDDNGAQADMVLAAIDHLQRTNARLLDTLAAVLPYAESRAEDLSEHKEQGNEDPEYPGADEAWAAVNNAIALLKLAGRL